MTNHLSTDEIVLAQDRALSQGRAAHVAACQACGDRVSDMRRLVTALSAVPVPEPSPLFWDHFSARVQRATADQPVVATAGTWRAVWRPWLAIGAVVAGAAFVMVVRMPPAASVWSGSHDQPVVAGTAATSGVSARATSEMASSSDAFDAASENDAPWQLVLGMASTLSVEDVQGLAPSAGAIRLSAEDLSVQERQAFIRLVRAQMEVQ